MFFHSVFCWLLVLSAAFASFRNLSNDELEIATLLALWETVDPQKEQNIESVSNPTIPTNTVDADPQTAPLNSINSVESGQESSSIRGSLEFHPNENTGEANRANSEDSEEIENDRQVCLNFLIASHGRPDDSDGQPVANSTIDGSRSSGEESSASDINSTKQSADLSDHTISVMPKPKVAGSFVVVENRFIPPFTIYCIISGHDEINGSCSMEIIVDPQTQQRVTEETLESSQASSSEVKGSGDVFEDLMNQDFSVSDGPSIDKLGVEEQGGDGEYTDDSLGHFSMETFVVPDPETNEDSVDLSSSWTDHNGSAADDDDSDEDDDEWDSRINDMNITESNSASVKRHSSANSSSCESTKDSKPTLEKKHEKKKNGGNMKKQEKRNQDERARLDAIYVAIYKMQSMFADFGHEVPEKSCFGHDVMLSLAKILPPTAKFLLATKNIALDNDQKKIMRRLAKAKLPKIPKLVTKQPRNLKKSYTSDLIRHLFECLEGLLPFEKSRHGVRATLEDQVRYIHEAAEYVFLLEAASRADEI